MTCDEEVFVSMYEKKYEKDDMVTYYFIIVKDKIHDTRVQAVTDDKNLLEFYLEFHKCKQFKVNKVHDYYKNIIELLNQCTQDNIDLYYIKTKSDDNKQGYTQMVVPMTETEMRMVADESSTFCASIIPYHRMNQMIPFLKNKYQKAIQSIRLDDIINSVLAKKSTPSYFIQSIQLDQLRVLLKLYPDSFGK